ASNDSNPLEPFAWIVVVLVLIGWCSSGDSTPGHYTGSTTDYILEHGLPGPNGEAPGTPYTGSQKRLHDR
ncbi:MAG: hypothetical protein ABIQ49_08370, partial [Gemmatimonadales bacterium]